MPFVEKYAVDFGAQSLTPASSNNPLHWNGMTHDHPSPADGFDAIGYLLNVSKGANQAKPVANNLYVRLKPGLLLDSPNGRIHMKVVFDIPKGTPLPGKVTGPEPWAVGLVASRTPDLDDPGKTASVTCQFSTNGVKLNSPGALQKDATIALDAPPLNYNNYQIAGSPTPSPTAVFTLEHSFCGLNAVGDKHASGTGWLTIDGPSVSRTDHRVYSTKQVAFKNPGGTKASIQALGVSVVTAVGFGDIVVRLRSFHVSLQG